MIARSLLELSPEVEYSVGDRVFHRGATQREPGIVTGILFRASCVIYLVTWGSTRDERYHYGVELAREFSQAESEGIAGQAPGEGHP